MTSTGSGPERSLHPLWGHDAPGAWAVLLRLAFQQLRSPLVAILAVGAGLAALTGSGADAFMVLLILLLTAGLSIAQEWRADQAMRQLRQQLAPTARVWRDGQLTTVPAAEVRPQDKIALRAGDLIPADCVLLESVNLLVVESLLTGESMPVEKRPASPEDAALWAGTSVRSGTGTAMVQRIGPDTRLASAVRPLSQARRASPFQQGVAEFGALLMRLLLVIVVLALVGEALRGRPVLEGLMMAMALAVGLSPELLPVIVSVTLSQGAWRLAKHEVLVRRLDAMEDLGSLDTLCIDKTGTLTTGQIQVHQALDPQGRNSPSVLRLAACNAHLEAGMSNPLDEALVAYSDSQGWFGTDDPLGRLPEKLAELPYDFERRRLTVVVRSALLAHELTAYAHGETCSRPCTSAQLVTKGAVQEVLRACTQSRSEDGACEALRPDNREQLLQKAADWGSRGFRVLAVATRVMPPCADSSPSWTLKAECEMVFEGLLLFEDPPRPDARQIVQALSARGVQIKLITGDNRHVAASLARAVGLPDTAVITGEALQNMRDDVLWHQARHCCVFAEIAPQDKARVVRALQRHGHIVGFLGDGINDAPALRTADVSISVQGAADVARHSADLVLTQSDLMQVAQSIDEGRRSFHNTRQYMAITASANLGNMMSMALGGWLLPFAPMTAHQILLNNLLSDLPAMTIPQDPMAPEAASTPQRWNLQEVHRFMWRFGLLSSAFDLGTFWLLWKVLDAPPAVFQAAWFLTSLCTELVVLVLLRSAAPFWGTGLTRSMGLACIAVIVAGCTVVYWPLAASRLGFEGSPSVWWVTATVALGFAAATEALKRRLSVKSPNARTGARFAARPGAHGDRPQARPHPAAEIRSSTECRSRGGS